MGGFPSQEKRPASAKSFKRSELEPPMVPSESNPAGSKPKIPKAAYAPETELEKKVVTTLKKLNKERLDAGKGNQSVMNRVLLNFPKMQTTFTELHDLYMTTDTDKSGSLEIDEIHVLMNKLNPGIDKKTVEEIFLQSDVHTDGQIDFKEFLTCLALGYLLDLIPDLNQSPSTFSLAPPSSTADNDSKADPAGDANQGEATSDQPSEAADADATAAPAEQAEASAEPSAEASTAAGEETSDTTEPAKTAEPAAADGEAGGEATATGETPPAQAVGESKAPENESAESADTKMKNRSTKRSAGTLPKIFQDRRGVRRVFELATEMYLAFDSNCTGTITFTEMERVINSTTGESEMTKNTQEVRKRRNSLNGKTPSKGVGPSELRGDRKSSPMTELLSRDRWKELDWDSDGFITYQEFIVTYVKWIASLSDSLDTDDEEDEN